MVEEQFRDSGKGASVSVGQSQLLKCIAPDPSAIGPVMSLPWQKRLEENRDGWFDEPTKKASPEHVPGS